MRVAVVADRSRLDVRKQAASKMARRRCGLRLSTGRADGDRETMEGRRLPSPAAARFLPRRR
jgi:hypothetical protein